MEEEIVEKKGISIVIKVLVILVVVAVIAILISFFVGRDSDVQNAGVIVNKSSDNEIPKIKNLGVNFEPYNELTGMAGDFKFTKTGGFKDMILVEFAYHIENEMGAKDQPEITYHLPLGTKVMAIGDGTVDAVTKLYSDDYAILYTSDENENWTFTNEHVINVSIEVGDHIVAGDVVGEVAPSEANGKVQELGSTEIAMFTSETDKITKVCPTMHLEESVEKQLQSDITTFLSDWEKFKGDTSIYDETKYKQFAVGCLKAEVVEIHE